jgi:tRNA-dihydrouridine synthase B
MQDEALAIEIVQAVVAACEPHGVPVTLKMRTGWCASGRNAPVLALAAESAGIQMLTVHGRTREQGYKGQAEHDTVAHIKSRVRIPVVANGDIDNPLKAQEVLRRTGADAIMIGRAAQGRPWIFREIAHFLATGEELPPPDLSEVRSWLLEHLEDHYALYGEFTGVRSARKHLGWYARALPLPPGAAAVFRDRINELTSCEAQLRCVSESLDEWRDAQVTWGTPTYPGVGTQWKMAA